MLKLTFFQSITDKVPLQKLITWNEITEYFSTFQIAPSRQDRHHCFSANTYLEGATRGTAGVYQMTGLVFDIDNKETTTPLTLEDLQRNEHLTPYRHWIYPTYSYFEKQEPRYRILIPFAQEVDKSQWSQVFDSAKQYFFQNHTGIDKSSRNPSQIYYVPYSNDNGTPALYGNFEGSLLNPHTLPQAPVREILFPQVSSSVSLGTPGRQERQEELEEALSFISADTAYETWLKVGMALHHELGEAGFPIWNLWSSTGSNYPGTQDLTNHWKSFKGAASAAPVTGKTLFKMAKEAGYAGRSAGLTRHYTINSSPGEEEEDPEDLPDMRLDLAFDFSAFETTDKFDLPCPLLQEVFTYLLKRNVFHVPLYALSGTIALCGFLTRYRLKTVSNLSTNFMVMALGGTGTGKTLTMGGIALILEHLHWEQCISNRLGSYQGSVEKLHKNGGCMFLLQDEATYEMRSTRSGNVSNAEMRIEEFRMKVFSRLPLGADTTKGNTIPTIQNPFYSEYSVATEDMLGHFKINDITKGLIPRYLMFISGEETHPKNLDVSHEMSRELENVLALVKNYSSDLHCTIATFSSEAIAYMDSFEKAMDGYKRECFRVKNHYEGIFARAVEHVTKLSLLTALEMPEGYVVTLRGVQWATSVVCHCIKTLLNSIADRLSENLVEENHKRVLRIVKEISKGEWVAKRNILQRTRFLTTRTLEDILMRLKEEGLIEIKEGRQKGSILVKNK